MAFAPTFPETFNMADYFLDARIEEGRGDRVAIRYRDESLSYRQVQQMSNRAGNALSRLGVGAEDRVLIVLPDGPEFVATWFGVLKIGAVFTMASTILSADDYRYFLRYTRAKVAVVHEEVMDRFASALEGMTGAQALRHVVVVGDGGDGGPEAGRHVPFAQALAEARPALDNEPTSRDDVAGWLFTSGTTGKPKGAVHLHHDFPYNTECYAKRVLGLNENDVTLSVPKLFFGYATGTNLMFPFAVGASTILFPERSTPERMFDLIEKHRPTVLTTVPTMIHQMLGLPGAAERDLSSLRFCVSAGEALPAELYNRWKETFGVEILDGIGSAEMFHIYISNRMGDVKLGSLGRVVEGYEAEIRDDEDNAVPHGEIGRLWVKGDSAAVMYWQAHQKSKEALRGDWVVSADLFRRDEDGYYTFAGRADDMLKVGGVFVSPLEVENCLLDHRAVREVAVVGVQDDAGLEVSCAFVAIETGFTPSEPLARELQEFVKLRLAPYKYPRLVRFLDALPRGATGKVLRQELRR